MNSNNNLKLFNEKNKNFKNNILYLGKILIKLKKTLVLLGILEIVNLICLIIFGIVLYNKIKGNYFLIIIYIKGIFIFVWLFIFIKNILLIKELKIIIINNFYLLINLIIINFFSNIYLIYIYKELNLKKFNFVILNLLFKNIYFFIKVILLIFVYFIYIKKIKQLTKENKNLENSDVTKDSIYIHSNKFNLFSKEKINLNLSINSI